MNRLPRLLLLTSLCFSLTSNAQQDISVSQFWNTYMHVNPAVTGLFNQHEANALYRNQWDGVNGAPNSVVGNYGARIDKIHGGIGASYSFDAIGFNRQQSAMVNYAYHLHFEDSSALSFGVSAGLLHFAVDPQWVSPQTGPDPSLPVASKASVFDANFGVVYHRKQWNAGVSLTHLTAPTLQLSGLSPGQNTSYNAALHSYIFAEYKINLSKDLVSTSRGMARTDFIKYSFDINEMITWRKQISVGIGYRTSDALSFMGAYTFKEKLRLGYSYDLTLNKLATISRGTHEIAATFVIK